MSVMRVRENVEIIDEIQSYVAELLKSVWYLEYLAVPNLHASRVKSKFKLLVMLSHACMHSNL